MEPCNNIKAWGRKVSNKRTGRNAAYSLIEIMVVVALLVMLAAMLFPVFGAAREKARTTTCVSNLHQIGAAVALYSQDNDGIYPYATDRASQYSPGWSETTPDVSAKVAQMPMLSDVLVPYLRNKNVWACPSDTGLLVDQDLPGKNRITTLKAEPSAFAQFGSSYAYTTELGLDHIPYSASGFYARDGQEVSASSVRVAQDMSPNWHDNGVFSINSVFADGHAATLNGTQFLAVSGVLTAPPAPAP